jgi:hypothetical protein
MRTTSWRYIFLFPDCADSPQNSSEAGLNVLKLDKTSEAFSKMISGFCTDCIVLSAEAKTTDKDGKRMGVKEGIYTHHTIVTDIGKVQGLNAAMVKCNGQIDFVGGFDSLNLINMGGDMPAEGSASGHSHGDMGSKSSPMAGSDRLSNPLASLYKGASPAALALAGGGLLTLAGTAVSALAGVMLATKSKLPGGVTVFFAAGAEGTENIFTANSTQVKSGFYIQKQDKLHLSAEVINYDAAAKEIYLSIEYEYVPGRQPGYLDVSLGAINVDGCARSAKEAMGRLNSLRTLNVSHVLI